MLKAVYCICYKFFRKVLCDYISGLRVSFCLSVEFFCLCFFFSQAPEEVFNGVWHHWILWMGVSSSGSSCSYCCKQIIKQCKTLTKAVEIKFVKPRQASYKTHKEQPLVRLSFFELLKVFYVYVFCFALSWFKRFTWLQGYLYLNEKNENELVR